MRTDATKLSSDFYTSTLPRVYTCSYMYVHVHKCTHTHIHTLIFKKKTIFIILKVYSSHEMQVWKEALVDTWPCSSRILYKEGMGLNDIELSYTHTFNSKFGSFNMKNITIHTHSFLACIKAKLLGLFQMFPKYCYSLSSCVISRQKEQEMGLGRGIIPIKCGSTYCTPSM